MGSDTQHYCLRWNNHRSNLLTVFDELLRNEAFTDVTLACEGGTSVKCHKMVLAACSSYFQTLFTELPCRHPVVVLKDVKASEMRAILEYMYRGEVNIAQEHLANLLKVAEALKVKGLMEEHCRIKEVLPPEPAHSPQSISTSCGGGNPAPVPHSSSNGSPPHPPHPPCPPFDHKKLYNLYGKSPVIERGSRMSLPLWGIPGLQFPHHPAPVPQPSHPHAAAAMLSSCYEGGAADMSPLKRKKLQSLLMSRDTPILRTVLGQGQADSSQQPMALVCDSHDRIHSNGSAQETDKQSMKMENSMEEARSPYTDISTLDEDPADKNNKIMMSQSFPNAVSSGIATYVPTQKPEWKRYKQYTRNDIMSAIDAVRNGMSALQAARKYGVPSRTLYDKVKKMGITTSRPFSKRGAGAGGGYFPYGGGSHTPSAMFGGGDGGVEEHSPPMEPLFLQHALDGMKRELGEAMGGGGGRSGGSSSSPGENGRSPSPPGPPGYSPQDQVEDLSVTRKAVIVSPPAKEDDNHSDNNSLDTHD